MSDFDKFKEDIALCLSKLLLNKPALVTQMVNPRQGVYRRTIDVLLPNMESRLYKGYSFLFQPAIPGEERRQTDEERNHYICFYNISLVPHEADEYGGIFVATIQRKPRKQLIIKNKVYEPIEIYLTNTLINLAMQIAPDLKVKHEYE